jgi:GNAT superfamily N-acetyltransferase
MFDRLNPDRPLNASLLLANGSPYRIRPSGANDRAYLAECFDGLSPESRRMRFFGNKGSLTPGDLDLFSGADGYDHIALAAVRIDAAGRELGPLGFARCMRLAPGGESAELSITVSDRFHGQGIGRALLDRLVALAYAQGIRHFRCEVLSENSGMRRLAQHLNGAATWQGGGVVEYDMALPEPVPADLAPDLPAPVQAQPDTELPWLMLPGAWVTPWPEIWQAHLDDCLALVEAANEDLVYWMHAA